MANFKFGVFEPKQIDTLRREVAQLVGKTFKFRYAWTMDEDDPFPGQVAWVIDRDDELRLGLTDEQRGWWFPDEDIRPIK